MSTETGTRSGSSTPPSSSINLESVRAIAKKDFQDAVRSWLFWGLSVFFFLLLVGLSGVLAYLLPDDFTTATLVGTVAEVTRLIIPLIALVLGWKAIAGERETGSIKVLLSLPHSRKDVLLGKLVGRSAVLSLSLVIGFVLAGIVVTALIGTFDVIDYVGLLALSIIYGVAYTSIAVGLSALTASTTMAAAAAFGVFILFYIVWNAIFVALDLLRSEGYISSVTYTTELGGGEVTVERLPDWAFFIDNLDPGSAYNRALTMVTEADIQSQIQGDMFPDGIPFYLQDWFSFLIILFWIVVPLAVALYRFDRVDL